jgi:DNA-binding NtrC family response regulator
MSSILVVDDEPAMREFYGRALLAGGYLAIESRTAEEGLDYLSGSADIGVVVADLNMPGRGGAWLVDQVRLRFPNVAVILATGDETVPGTLSLQASVVKYLVKPVSAVSLLVAVREALEWRQQRSIASPAGGAGADQIEAWLDKKLTRGHGDGTDHFR